MQDVVFGQERARSWPTPRGKPKTAAAQERLNRFRIVQKAASYLAPDALAYIHRATKGSPLLVRDVVTMQLFNRWLAFILEDGRTLWPMPAINDVSEALDVLSSFVGDYLVRTSEGWRGASTLPAQPSRVKQARVALTADVFRPAGFHPHFPFQSVVADAPGWWRASPDYGFLPDVAGFYLAEVSLQCNNGSLQDVGLYSPATSALIARSRHQNGAWIADFAKMIWLDGATKVTSAFHCHAGTTITANNPSGTSFQITGPF